MVNLVPYRVGSRFAAARPHRVDFPALIVTKMFHR
jgi:hypothetical protein